MQRDWTTSVMGATPEYFDVANWRIEAGRAFTEAEYRAGRSVCVVGRTVREKLFEREQPVGARIRVGKFSCEVIGLLTAKGQVRWDTTRTTSSSCRCPRCSAGSPASRPPRTWVRILVSARTGADIEAVLRDITQLMRERRRIGHNEDDDFIVIDTRQIAETRTRRPA